MKKRIARKIIGEALAGRAACYKTDSIWKARLRITRPCFTILASVFNQGSVEARRQSRKEMLEDYAECVSLKRPRVLNEMLLGVSQ